MRRIPPEVIEQVAAATDIVEVIGSYFALKRAGATYKANCPFHNEKTPSFTVNPQRQIFKCFGCGAGGGVFRFVMDYEHIEFGAAVRKLAERAGIRIVEQELTPEDEARVDMRRRLLALHADTAEFFHELLLKKQSAQPGREYLKSRGIGGEIARNWKIGYAPDTWNTLSRWLGEQGYAREEILQSGLVSQREGESDYYDRFRGRVMFPICNDVGEVIAFSGRILKPDEKAAKYVNSPETPLFVKGAVLFGIHRSKRALIDKKSAIVCEGQLDLITAFEAGVQNVIAAQGTAFTARQARVLKRYVDEVVLCFDADSAGQKASEKSLPYLLGESLAVRVVSMPAGEDPDSLIRSKGAEAFVQRVDAASDFFDFQLDRLTTRPDWATPRGKAQAARQLAGWMGLVNDSLMQQAIVNKASMRLEVSPQELSKLVQQQPRPSEKDDAELDQPAPPKRIALDPTLHLLALAALHDEDARAWLLEEDWPRQLESEPEAGLLTKILGGDYQPGNPASLQSFLTTLEAAEESAVSGLLGEKPPANALVIARDCWNELERRQLRRRMETLKAKLRNPALSVEETTELQKEILDRQKRLLDIARPLSPPL